mmetsp:Transcript_19186/g.32953  ORF Transcript_19186/g.32953 Transcript_19186/m.32953 type:complete len:118 (+) Transcript_19186:69-422(+)
MAAAKEGVLSSLKQLLRRFNIFPQNPVTAMTAEYRYPAPGSHPLPQIPQGDENREFTLKYYQRGASKYAGKTTKIVETVSMQELLSSQPAAEETDQLPPAIGPVAPRWQREPRFPID